MGVEHGEGGGEGRSCTSFTSKTSITDAALDSQVWARQKGEASRGCGCGLRAGRRTWACCARWTGAPPR